MAIVQRMGMPEKPGCVSNSTRRAWQQTFVKRLHEHADVCHLYNCLTQSKQRSRASVAPAKPEAAVATLEWKQLLVATAPDAASHTVNG